MRAEVEEEAWSIPLEMDEAKETSGLASVSSPRPPISFVAAPIYF